MLRANRNRTTHRPTVIDTEQPSKIPVTTVNGNIFWSDASFSVGIIRNTRRQRRPVVAALAPTAYLVPERLAEMRVHYDNNMEDR